MPRGSALGMVSMLSEKDELSWSRKQLMARLDVAMGGRVAEEITFGAENVTSGIYIASSIKFAVGHLGFIKGFFEEGEEGLAQCGSLIA